MAAQNLPKHTYTATSPDGRTATRTTTRAYSHVVFVVHHDGHWDYDGKWIVEPSWRWAEAGWSGSLELAQKIARQYSEVTIVPVSNPR